MTFYKKKQQKTSKVTIVEKTDKGLELLDAGLSLISGLGLGSMALCSVGELTPSPLFLS